MGVIEVKNLSKHFKDVRAVDAICFSVEKGEIFGFLGPNGAGKTTTIRCMMDFIRPTSGEIRILGMDSQKNSVELKKKIGYLSGQLRLYDKWTGQDHIDFVKNLNGDNDIAQSICKRFDFDPSLKVKTLSSGNKQKLGIVMAFMTRPEILIMDEPTNALDPLLQNTTYELIEEVTKQGTTVFFSSHNLAEVDRICHRVGIIKKGKIVATESIHNLKEMRLYSVAIDFKSGFDKRIFQFEGIQIKKILPKSIMLTVKGDVNSLLKKLSTLNVHDVEIQHATLEDIFLEYYE
ncbi:MAG: ABC transporter ATP-binding protein [Patescibacteria group bacterium]